MVTRRWLFALSLFLAVPSFAQSEPAAVVNGTPVTRADVDASIAERLTSLEQQIYTLRKTSLDNLIATRLLQEAAAKQGVTLDEFKRRLMDAPVDVDAAEVEREYQENISAFGSMSGDEARERVRAELQTRIRLQRYRETVAALRAAANITVHLQAPTPAAAERQPPVLGRRGAPVTLTVFSDFSCPHCRNAQATIKKLHETYRDRLAIEYRHFPISSASATVARAAVCADEQGRFWQFHDAAFAAPNLSDAQIDVIASVLRLDTARFEQCLTSDRSRAVVAADVSEGRRHGVTGTPAFVVNGSVVRGTTFEALQRAVDGAAPQAD